MLKVEHVDLDSVTISMLGTLSRPLSVTIQEWQAFWNEALTMDHYEKGYDDGYHDAYEKYYDH